MPIDPNKDAKSRALYEKIRGELSPVIDRGVYEEMVERFDDAGDVPRAVAAARKVVEMAPDSVDAHFRLATLLLKNEQWRDGGRELEVCADLDTVELASRHWSRNGLYYIAYALFNIGSFKEASEAFRGAQNLIDTWGDPYILKRFHWHQGMSLHLQGLYLDAAEAYRRAMVAPGPGDSCAEDEMDEDIVETAQDMNDEIEPYMELAQQGKSIDPQELVVRPAFL
ncbi:MAG: tetratricopeptide repeat protein [Planctomycetota bacterium]